MVARSQRGARAAIECWMMPLLTWWLEEDMPMMPAEIDSMYQRLALPSIEQFIQALTRCQRCNG